MSKDKVINLKDFESMADAIGQLYGRRVIDELRKCEKDSDTKGLFKGRSEPLRGDLGDIEC